MKKHMFTSVSGVLLLAILSSFIIQPKRTVWMIGDSTMAIKAPDKFPETGWGVPFAKMFKSNVEVVNKAKNGRSTKSCIHEGTWAEVYAGMKAGDYVFIQFGHNDQKVHKPSTGTTIDEYKANLSLFVKETRAKNAYPILLTPIARRAFENGKLVDTHGAYPDAVRAVADSLQVPLIDLTVQTSDLLTHLGEERSTDLFLHLPAGSENYPKGVKDNTHLNVQGAETIAQLVVDAMGELHVALAEEVNPGKKENHAVDNR